jgi:hypothetical protein
MDLYAAHQRERDGERDDERRATARHPNGTVTAGPRVKPCASTTSRDDASCARSSEVSGA